MASLALRAERELREALAAAARESATTLAAAVKASAAAAATAEARAAALSDTLAGTERLAARCEHTPRAEAARST